MTIEIEKRLTITIDEYEAQVFLDICTIVQAVVENKNFPPDVDRITIERFITDVFNKI